MSPIISPTPPPSWAGGSRASPGSAPPSLASSAPCWPSAHPHRALYPSAIKFARCQCKTQCSSRSSPQASGCACVQLWHFNQRSALGALVALIPTPAAEVRALAWCTQSLPASAFPSPPSHPDHEQRSDASRPAPCFFLLAAALSSGEVEVSSALAPHPSLIHLAFSHVCLQVWSIPSSLIAARCSRALDSRAVAADGFDAWALLRPTVRGARCTIELEPVLPCMSDLIL